MDNKVILANIFKFLNNKDLCICAQINKKWKMVVAIIWPTKNQDLLKILQKNIKLNII